jgi:hypothetical protein
MRKLTKDDLDTVILQMIKQRDRLEPHVKKYMDEIIPLAGQYKDKAIDEYKQRVLPQITKHKKVMLTLFYMYTMTSNYRLSQKRSEWTAKIGRMIR